MRNIRVEKSSAGWTLAELTIVILIVSIISIAVMTGTNPAGSAKLFGAGEKVAMDLINARRLALTEHRIYVVDFTGDSYTVGYLDESTGEITDVPCPYTGEEKYAVDFSAGGKFSGVVISSVNFSGASRVRFGSFGAPFDGAGNKLEDDGYIILEYKTAVTRISVVSGTGTIVHER